MVLAFPIELDMHLIGVKTFVGDPGRFVQIQNGLHIVQRVIREIIDLLGMIDHHSQKTGLFAIRFSGDPDIAVPVALFFNPK